MPFVTKLRLQSGDREAVDAVVTDIKQAATRKGAEFRGPHPKPPTELRVPQYKRVDSGESFDPWAYTVYTRTVEIVGHDEFVREVADRSLPDSVHLSAEVEQVRGPDGR
ncbi:MAG: 30S ribosomal protein S10 [Halobacteriales archaeon SW_9_67_25]|jgi:ribosomal protein S10|nr:MAG: 30S ribosomal protein S10 [Halobacteriales archaeon SW_9_67_25]